MTVATIHWENDHGIVRVAWDDIFAFTGGDYEGFSANAEKYDDEIVQRLLNSGAPTWVNGEYHDSGADDQYWYLIEPKPHDEPPPVLRELLPDFLQDVAEHVWRTAKQDGLDTGNLDIEYVAEKFAAYYATGNHGRSR
jgi:hypothetical protein